MWDLLLAFAIAAGIAFVLLAVMVIGLAVLQSLAGWMSRRTSGSGSGANHLPPRTR